MGIHGYLNQSFVHERTFRSSNLGTCLEHLTAHSNETPKIVLVDGDNFRGIWNSFLRLCARHLSDQTFRRGDFIKECRDRASYKFVQKVQSVLAELSNHFEAVYVIWGNPEVEPIVKAAIHVDRQEEKAMERSTFVEVSQRNVSMSSGYLIILEHPAI